eukprot:2648290-Pyramimonas_sp.AAC.1
MDQDVNPRGPELVVPVSLGELRPETSAMHEAQQANLSARLARQQRNQARQARRMMNRAGQPALSLSAQLAMGP